MGVDGEGVGEGHPKPERWWEQRQDIEKEQGASALAWHNFKSPESCFSGLWQGRKTCSGSTGLPQVAEGFGSKAEPGSQQLTGAIRALALLESREELIDASYAMTSLHLQKENKDPMGRGAKYRTSGNQGKNVLSFICFIFTALVYIHPYFWIWKKKCSPDTLTPMTYDCI